MAYRVPDEKVDAVLADLDFREKGGYTRAVVDIFRSDDGESIYIPGIYLIAVERCLRRTVGRAAELQSEAPPSTEV